MTIDASDLPPAPDSGLFGGRWDVEAPLIILSVPWEATASYGRGSSRTPDLLPGASHQLDFFDPVHARPLNPQQVSLWRAPTSWKAMNQRCVQLADQVMESPGDRRVQAQVAEVNRCSRILNRELESRVWDCLQNGHSVGILGGDHSSPFGSIAAHARYYRNLGVLHLDAHADLREGYMGFNFSHASIMNRVIGHVQGISQLVSVGLRDLCEQEYRMAQEHPRITPFFQHELLGRLDQGEPWARLCAEIVDRLPENVYVSLDVDGLDPWLCPHTGTPVPEGLSFRQAISLLCEVSRSGRNLVGFDVCEVSAAKDPATSEWDLNVGARLLFRLCCEVLEGRKGRR